MFIKISHFLGVKFPGYFFAEFPDLLRGRVGIHEAIAILSAGRTEHRISSFFHSSIVVKTTWVEGSVNRLYACIIILRSNVHIRL